MAAPSRQNINNMKNTADLINTAVATYDRNLQLKPKQLECLQIILSYDCDVLVNLPVGYGKSLIYSILPSLLGPVQHKQTPVVIVVSPLNIIQKDQLKSLKDHRISACRFDVKCRATGQGDDDDVIDNVNDDNNMGDMGEEVGPAAKLTTDVDMRDVKAGRYSIILCHPEALLNTSDGRDLMVDEEMQNNVVAIVIDECHLVETWGEQFRTAFKELKRLKAFFTNVPFVALSGTMTKQQKIKIPTILGLKNYRIVECSPDFPHIFLEKIHKTVSQDVLSVYEEICHKEANSLFEKKEDYPITLMFLPVYYMSEALLYLNELFESPSVDTSLYSAICSGQDDYVITETIKELQKAKSRLRLVLTTSIAGMGFDPDNVTRIIHTCPPRSLTQYIQEVGRAGRRGQLSTATLYYSKRDIAKNLPGITDDIIDYCTNDSLCLRDKLLSVYGFSKDEFLDPERCCSFCLNDNGI